MTHGFTYQDALDMGYRDYRRYTAIFNAWSIPAEMREGGTRKATKQDIEEMFASDE